MKINVTIIIPTYNRLNALMNLLTSISKYINPSQIIIIEQCQNNKVKIIKQCKYLGLPCTYIFLQTRSTTIAINRGVRMATGRIIVLLDDDVLVTLDFLINHLQNYKDSKVGAVCGRVLTLREKNKKNIRNVGSVSSWGTFSDGYSSAIRQEIDTFIGCNVSFRKKAFVDLGGLDENFTQNAIRFEADFSLRIKKIGYKVIFDPTAVVVHTRVQSGGTRMENDRSGWYFHFFSNETYFYLKHKRKILFPLFLLTRSYWIIRCISRFRKNLNLQYVYIPFLGILNGIHKYFQFKRRSEYV